MHLPKTKKNIWSPLNVKLSEWDNPVGCSSSYTKGLHGKVSWNLNIELKWCNQSNTHFKQVEDWRHGTKTKAPITRSMKTWVINLMIFCHLLHHGHLGYNCPFRLCSKWAIPGFCFVYSHSFQIVCQNTVGFCEIWTRIVRVEGENPDHMTTTFEPISTVPRPPPWNA